MSRAGSKRHSAPCPVIPQERAQPASVGITVRSAMPTAHPDPVSDPDTRPPAAGSCGMRLGTSAHVTLRGRTLLEMVVALAVIGVVAAAVASALPSRRDPDGVARASRELTQLLRRARATAAQRAEVVTVVLDPARGRVWVATGSAAALAEDSLDVEAGVVLEAPAPRVVYTFAPTGEASGAPVVVRDAARAVLVRVDRWTGEPHAEPR